MPVPMVPNLSGLHAHLDKPVAIELDGLLPSMKLFGKRPVSMPAENQHWHIAGQAVADDYNVVHIVPGS